MMTVIFMFMIVDNLRRIGSESANIALVSVINSFVHNLLVLSSVTKSVKFIFAKMTWIGSETDMLVQMSLKMMMPISGEGTEKTLNELIVMKPQVLAQES